MKSILFPGHWENYRETVYSADADWMREHIIRPAVRDDPTVAPWDNWRVVERNGGLQAQIQRVDEKIAVEERDKEIERLAAEVADWKNTAMVESDRQMELWHECQAMRRLVSGLTSEADANEAWTALILRAEAAEADNKRLRNENYLLSRDNGIYLDRQRQAEAECERLREALRTIAVGRATDSAGSYNLAAHALRAIARAALGEQP